MVVGSIPTVGVQDKISKNRNAAASRFGGVDPVRYDYDLAGLWCSWRALSLIILGSWVRSPHCAFIKRLSRIGAVGSALVLCTGGPGFEPLILHLFIYASRISLVGQDSWLSPGRHGFDSRMRYTLNILMPL